MTIRILKPISVGTGNARPGEVRDMPDRIARAWIKKGVAEKYVADEGDSSPFTLVEKGAGWYEIVKNGETVDKVRGEKAARERVEELRDE